MSQFSQKHLGSMRSLSHASTRRSLLRTLRFDLLEDRRLLASLDVYVFDDMDGSRGKGSEETAVVGRMVYVDLNRDNRVQSNEPVSITNADGHALFDGLSEGEYVVRLVGSNRSVVQTTPVAPAERGSWAPFAPSISKTVAWSENGSAWVISDSRLSEVDLTSGKTVHQFTLGSVLDAALVRRSGSTQYDGYVLALNTRNQKELYRVNTETMESTSQGLDVATAQSVLSIGSDLFITKVDRLQSPSVQSVYRIGQSSLAGTSQTYPIPGLDSLAIDAQVKGLGNSSVAVLEPISTGSRVSVFALHRNGAELLSERSFSEPISQWEASPAGDQIAIQTSSGVIVIGISAGLPTLATLPQARGPLVFDAVRGQLLTGSNNPSSADDSRITAWSTSDWSEQFSLSVADRPANAGIRPIQWSVSLDGQYLTGIGLGSLYRHALGIATSASAKLLDAATTYLQFGVRSVAANTAPVVSFANTFAGDEDSTIDIAAADLLSGTVDADGDSVYFAIESASAHGQIAWSAQSGGSYRPNADFNGTDSFVIRAFDGREWSNARTVAINVRPVNDAPRDVFTSVNSIAENLAANVALLQLGVVDPDSDANYQFTVDDPRFIVSGSSLMLKSGSNVNFEKEPTLVLPVHAVDRAHPSDSVSRMLTVSVLDRNDPPTAIVAPDNVTVPELTEDVVLGTVFVMDEDAISDYIVTSSDSRFVVVDNQLRLAPGKTLDFETQSRIVVALRAYDLVNASSIERSITVQVSDQDDPPLDIVLSGSGQVPEKRPGYAIGNVSVIDQDAGERYLFTVSDDRFEVVNGVAKLKNGVSLLWEDPGFLDLTFSAISARTGFQIKRTGRLTIIKDPTPYHNDINPCDVDGDGSVSPLDPLIIINHINTRGTGPMDPEGEGKLPDLDVNGDGVVSPLDILIVINRLNDGSHGNGEGGNGNNGSGGGNGGGDSPEGEGPSELVEQLPLTPQLATPLQMPNRELLAVGTSTNSSFSQNVSGQAMMPVVSTVDLSLASYLAELSTEIGPKRSRRF